jgi:hypothetical protein
VLILQASIHCLVEKVTLPFAKLEWEIIGLCGESGGSWKIISIVCSRKLTVGRCEGFCMMIMKSSMYMSM